MKGPPVVHKNPLGMIKGVAVGSLKAPVNATGSVLSLAKGAASAGRTVSVQATRTATSKAAGAVSTLVGGRKVSEAPSPEPVNVSEELGLDPTPVQKPRSPKKAAPSAKPITKIDAAADPSSVDVTPVDVAERVGGGERSPGNKPAD
jgi:hypothetical protein